MKLLVAVSNEPYEPGALDALASLAGTDPVTVLHAGKPGDRLAAVEAAAARLVAAGAHVTLVIEQGDAAKAVAERARTEKPDVVVVRGHDRHPGLLKRAFGDTVQRIIETCPRPVLALRGSGAPKGRDVMLAGGRPSSRMLDITASVATATGSRVSLVHVMPTETTVFLDPEPSAEPPPEPAWVAGVVQSLRSRGAEVSVVEREGLVERALAEEANSGRYWLTVVRGRPVGFLHRLLLGHSFTEDLVRHVGTSVLLLR